MHLVDITMFYAAEGGGVSTYLNAKARWLAQRSRVHHTILSPNIGSATPGTLTSAGEAAMLATLGLSMLWRTRLRCASQRPLALR